MPHSFAARLLHPIHATIMFLMGHFVFYKTTGKLGWESTGRNRVFTVDTEKQNDANMAAGVAGKKALKVACKIFKYGLFTTIGAAALTPEVLVVGGIYSMVKTSSFKHNTVEGKKIAKTEDSLYVQKKLLETGMDHANAEMYRLGEIEKLLSSTGCAQTKATSGPMGTAYKDYYLADNPKFYKTIEDKLLTEYKDSLKKEIVKIDAHQKTIDKELGKLGEKCDSAMKKASANSGKAKMGIFYQKAKSLPAHAISKKKQFCIKARNEI